MSLKSIRSVKIAVSKLGKSFASCRSIRKGAIEVQVNDRTQSTQKILK